MANKKPANKKKPAAKKEPKKKESEDDFLDDDFLGEGVATLAENDDEDLESDLNEEDAEIEDEVPAPKVAQKPVSDEGETLQSKLRKKEAARKSRVQPKIKKVWYEFKRGNTYNPKKGLKLVRFELTESGAQSTYMGWEKKIPVGFLKRIRASGELKE